MNQEGKACAELVELTIKVFHHTRNVSQVMHLTVFFINWNKLFKLISKLPVQASNGFPLAIHRGKGKKLS